MIKPELIKEHLEFTSKTFPLGTAMGALLHAKRELDEVESAMNYHEGVNRVTEEMSDAFGCLIDCCNRNGITPEMLNNAFAKKLEINKARKWKSNGDGSYSHIKNSAQ